MPSSAVDIGPTTQDGTASAHSLVENEISWRQHTGVCSTVGGSHVEIGRWRHSCEGYLDVRANPTANHYTVEILMGTTRIDCFKDGHLISSGRAGIGAVQISAPGQAIRCRFERASEAVHIYIPRSKVLEMYTDLRGHNHSGCAELPDPCYRTDPAMGKLGQAILDADSIGEPFARQYCESITMAVLTRTLGMQKSVVEGVSGHEGLAGWRLRRATEFIEANLSAPITLAEVALQVGLSRMHFAAQFRRATGLAPHRFLIYRRIEKAKEMLANRNISLVEIALHLGFSSQAHFTTAFRNMTGTTPAQWRATQLNHSCIIYPR